MRAGLYAELVALHSKPPVAERRVFPREVFLGDFNVEREGGWVEGE